MKVLTTALARKTSIWHKLLVPREANFSSQVFGRCPRRQCIRATWRS